MAGMPRGFKMLAQALLDLLGKAAQALFASINYKRRDLPI